jgi:hypothetical protein
VAYLAWWPMFWQQLEAGTLLRQTFPGWEEVVSFSILRAPALTFGKFLFGVIDLEVTGVFLLITIVFVGLCLACLGKSGWLSKTANRSKIYLWFYFLILPFLLASIVSLVVPVIQPKRVIFLLPFAYLLLSFLIFGPRDNWSHLGVRNWSLLLLVLALNLYGTFSYYTKADYQRENWRHAVATLHQDYNPSQTLVMFAYPAPFSPWSWYEAGYGQTFPTLATGTYDTKTLGEIEATLSPAFGYNQVIVFDYLRSLTDSNNQIPTTLINNNFVETKIYDYKNLGFIRVYSQLMERAQ